MSKSSIISIVATVGALLAVAPAAGYAAEDNNHNYQEAQAQRDVAALHEPVQSTQSAARPTLQAAVPTSAQPAAQK